MKEVFLLYYRPSQAFKNLRLWVVVLVILLLTIIGFLISSDIIFKMAQEKMLEALEKRGIPLEKAPPLNFRVFLIWSTLGILVSIPLKIFLQGFYLNFMANFFQKGRSLYDGLLVSSGGALLSSTGSFLKGLFMKLFQTPNVRFDLTLFLPDTLEKTFIYALFSQIDFFTLWGLWIMLLGYEIRFEMDRKKSLMIILGAWLFLILTTALSRLLFKAP